MMSSQPNREIAVNTSELPPVARQQLAEIAMRMLRVEALETRHSDRLDFYDMAVWSIRDALEAAYLAGVANAKAGVAEQDPAIRHAGGLQYDRRANADRPGFSRQLSRSPHARLLADEVHNGLTCGVALSDAVATVMQRQTNRKIGSRMNRPSGFAHGLPRLTRFVIHCGLTEGDTGEA
ncbi:DUF6900 domain-containing protein [Paraburkholderia sediminicola]|uniref:DUF6900 domain-containing protein n=1 Tax=Paraburkholderia sediminicola TaxID=458836 RepID=UPI000E7195E8